MSTIELLLANIRNNNFPFVKQIVEESPQLLTIEDANNKKTLIFVATQDLQDEAALPILHLFANFGANFSHEDNDNRTVAFTLCAKGMINCLKFIMQCNDQVLYHKDRLGQTPLFGAVRKNQLKLIKAIDIPTDLINICDTLCGHSLLFYAAACGHEEMCKALVIRGADPLLIDYCGQDIFTYTSKIPKFAKHVKSIIDNTMQLDNQKQAEQEAQAEPKEKQIPLQAYEMKIIKKNQVKSITNKDKSDLLQLYKQLEEKRASQAYFSNGQDEFDNYSQNWRHIAIKIIDSCLKLMAGKWFEHTSKARELFTPEELKGLQKVELVDLRLISSKLVHHVYQTSKQFYDDISKVWENCERLNGPNSQMTKYALQVRKHVFDLMKSYDFVDKYF